MFECYENGNEALVFIRCGDLLTTENVLVLQDGLYSMK